LTTTGGCLLSGLVFGHFSHVGPVNLMPKTTTLKVLRELGLVFFLMGAGISGGSRFVELFQPVYFLYGIIITIGIIAGVLYAMYRAKHEGMKADDVLDYALWVIVSAVIGARVYYVVTDSGTTYHSFYDIIAIWEGGLAIYGAVIAGAAAILVVSLVKKYNKTKVFKMFDMVSPGVMLGQIIGRWGNFCNGEAFGIKTSAGYFLRMGLKGYYSYASYDDWSLTRFTYYHPTFLYESLWNLLGFVLINIFYKKKKFDGQIILMYLSWYGLGRMFIEGLRTDSLYVGVFRISQVLGFLCFGKRF
jgi:phosphatidylglycerol:prolipoprotein diacylglycerol transferase